MLPKNLVSSVRVAAFEYKQFVEKPVFKLLFQGNLNNIQAALQKNKPVLCGSRFSVSGYLTLLEQVLQVLRETLTQWKEDADGLVNFVSEQMPADWSTSLDILLEQPKFKEHMANNVQATARSRSATEATSRAEACMEDAASTRVQAKAGCRSDVGRM